MSKAVTTSRHRADIPTKTPLSHLSGAVSANAGTLGRRGAVIAAAGGLIVTMGLPASATEAHDNALVKVQHAANSSPQQILANNAALTVPSQTKADAKKADTESTGFLTFKATAAPEPAPEPEPAAESAATTTTMQTAEAARPSNTSRSESTRSTTHRSTTSSSAHAATKSESSSSADSSASQSSSSSSAPSSSKGGSIVSIAARYTGVPYVLGGKTPSGWDCSGYVSYVYAQAGKNIPSQTDALRSAGTVVSASEARPGDLVWSPGHVGIYAGNGMMYDAGNPRVDTTHRSFSWMGNVTFLRF